MWLMEVDEGKYSNQKQVHQGRKECIQIIY